MASSQVKMDLRDIAAEVRGASSSSKTLEAIVRLRDRGQGRRHDLGVRSPFWIRYFCGSKYSILS